MWQPAFSATRVEWLAILRSYTTCITVNTFMGDRDAKCRGNHGKRYIRWKG